MSVLKNITDEYFGETQRYEDSKGNKDNNGENNTSSGGNNNNIDLKGDLRKNVGNNSGKNSDIEVTYVNPKNRGDSIIDRSTIGYTGTFIDTSNGNPFANEDFYKEFYGEEGAKKIVRELNNRPNEISEKDVKEIGEKTFNSLPDNDPFKIIWDNGRKYENAYKNMWKEVLKNFLRQKTRRASEVLVDSNTTIRWGNRRMLPLGIMAPYYDKEAQDPQDLNIYVDVSGSVNMELMQIFAESLVAFMKSYKYSAINIIPWAEESTGIHRVESISKNGSEKAIDEIIKYLGEGKCGCGTDLVHACVPEIVDTVFQYKHRKNKDDVHVIITDGDVGKDVEDIENTIMNAIKSKSIRPNLPRTVVKNCIWMVYDNNDDIWENNIKLGKLVKISSKNVIHAK